MAIRSSASETAAIAFLQKGHPRLAFATIVLKESCRLALAALLIGGLSVGMDGKVLTIIKQILLAA